MGALFERAELFWRNRIRLKWKTYIFKYNKKKKGEIKKMTYASIYDVKELLQMTKTNQFDTDIDSCLRDADNWLDIQLEGLPASVLELSIKRSICRYYGAYLFRTTAFETHMEESSTLAQDMKKTAIELINKFKLSRMELVRNGDKKKCC